MGILKPKKKAGSLVKAIIYVFALQQNISMKHSGLGATRIVIAAILFYNLITSSLFQSSITKNLNTNQVKGRITSVDGLIANHFKIGMPPYIAPIFGDLDGLNKVNILMRQSGQTIEEIKQPYQFFDGFLLDDDKHAYLWSESYVDTYLNQYYDSNTGENLFEHIPEVVFEFYVSLMAPKSSPFIERFNEVLVQFVETGIGNYHKSRAKADMNMNWIWRLLNGKTPRPRDKAIKWNDVAPLFNVYWFCCSVSFGVFFVEIIFHKFIGIFLRKKKKIPKRKALNFEWKNAIFYPAKELENAVLKKNFNEFKV